MPEEVAEAAPTSVKLSFYNLPYTITSEEVRLSVFIFVILKFVTPFVSSLVSRFSSSRRACWVACKPRWGTS